MKNYGLSPHCARARACQRRGNPTLNECVAAGDSAAVHRSDGCAAPGSRLSRAEGGAGRGRMMRSSASAVCTWTPGCWGPGLRFAEHSDPPCASAPSEVLVTQTPWDGADALGLSNFSAGLPRHTSFQAADLSGKFFNCGGERKPYSFRSWNCLEGEAKRWRGLEVRKVQRLRGDQFYLLHSFSQPPRPCLLSFLFWTPENLN